MKLRIFISALIMTTSVVFVSGKRLTTLVQKESNLSALSEYFWSFGYKHDIETAANRFAMKLVTYDIRAASVISVQSLKKG